jgi:hypothetical protein
MRAIMKTGLLVFVLLLLTSSVTADAQPRFVAAFYETAKGRTQLPTQFMPELLSFVSPWTKRYEMPDGRTVTFVVQRIGENYEVSLNWLAFGALNPIMEVGPTRNVAFWNLPREPRYDTQLIALWRLYARLHERLIDYSYAHAHEATKTSMPIVRPLFLVDPAAPAAWSNWWTYLYGRDLLVSPVWEKGRSTSRSTQKATRSRLNENELSSCALCLVLSS